MIMAKSNGIGFINNHLLKYNYSGNNLNSSISPKNKYWQNGDHGLDEIRSYLHCDNHSTQYWFYVTLGLSDLHGDDRVHQYTSADDVSGYGFELTFRLKRLPNHGDSCPIWPFHMITCLADYIFSTGNTLNCGDHVPWPSKCFVPGTQIRHFCIADDSRIGVLHSSLGTLHFRQLVGITGAELTTLQRWSGSPLVDLLRQVPQAGGDLLITDMSRTKSMFNLRPDFVQIVVKKLEQDGSSLTNLTCDCKWTSSNALSSDPNVHQVLNSVNLQFNYDTSVMIPLIMKDRLQQGNYFSFQNTSDQVILLIPNDFSSDMVKVDDQKRIVCIGNVLQIYCSAYLIDDIILEFEELESIDNFNGKSIEFEQPNIKVKLVK